MLCPASAFLSVHSFQILLMYLYFPYTHSEGGYLCTPPPNIFSLFYFFVYLFGLAYLLLYLIGFSNDLFSPFFYSLSMNIRFSLQFLTYSTICIVLSAQYYTLFICHSAYFSSKTTPYRVLPYITQYYRFKLIIANPYT